MRAAGNLFEVAALVGDTPRATMLADLAHVSCATASDHLAKLAARLAAGRCAGKYAFPDGAQRNPGRPAPDYGASRLHPGYK